MITIAWNPNPKPNPNPNPNLNPKNNRNSCGTTAYRAPEIAYSYDVTHRIPHQRVQNPDVRANIAIYSNSELRYG